MDSIEDIFYRHGFENELGLIRPASPVEDYPLNRRNIPAALAYYDAEEVLWLPCHNECFRKYQKQLARILKIPYTLVLADTPKAENAPEKIGKPRTEWTNEDYIQAHVLYEGSARKAGTHEDPSWNTFVSHWKKLGLEIRPSKRYAKV